MFEHFTVIPSIDLRGGQVVRLLRGDVARVTVYSGEPAAVARSFAADGAELIHVVDLDGALAGEPRNLAAICRIREAVACPIEVSGGLRTIDSVRAITAAGAAFVSLGSAAFLNPELIKQACDEFPGRVFGSADVDHGRLAIKGWVEASAMTLREALERFATAGIAALILTDISRDGTERGMDRGLFEEVARSTAIRLIASGGAATLDDIRRLSSLWQSGVRGVIIGRALYERRFSLPEAMAAAAL